MYSWSSSEGWMKVGDVVGAAGESESTKTLHDGKEYDFVFSVDIAEGQPPLKLPFNNSQDPWAVAQKFIHDHQLSQQYLDTVANFIITNSKPGELRPPFHFFFQDSLKFFDYLQIYFIIVWNLSNLCSDPIRFQIITNLLGKNVLLFFCKDPPGYFKIFL